jgi:hypothetical protein
MPLTTSDNPLLQQLGYDRDARLVLFHVDDVGMCHGANQAWFDLSATPVPMSGSVMMPCPWSQEAVTAAVNDPALDLGIHLTLNSEWTTGYRWGPLSTRDLASGLIDDSGWFHHRPPQTLANLVPDAACAEMDLQVAWAHRLGLDFTHIDAHMGTAMSGRLVRHFLELGCRYNVPVLLPRHSDDSVRTLSEAAWSLESWRELTSEAEARGMPLVDTFRITAGYGPGDQESDGGQVDAYEAVLRALPAGITYFSLHANAPGDIEVINPARAHWRTFEYEYFQSQRLRDLLSAEKIVPIGYRAIRDIMRGEGRSS